MNDFVGYIDSDGKIFDGTFDYEGHVGPIGPQGPEGYTPVRGVDYWTEADQNYIVAEATSLINGKIEEYNSNCVAKTSEFDTNASNKTDAFNSNASSKTTEFNNNATSKTGTFNDNAASKTSDYNANYLIKLNSFDSNATSKKGDYNDNAVAKMNTFNLNATNKTNAFDGHVDEEFNELTGNFYTKTQIDGFGYGTYSKPSGGIPSTDMSSDVQVSLGKADTAVQDVSGKEDLSNKVTSISGSSTDDQYPSAKLLYDQLALKYNTSDGGLIKKLTESSYDIWDLDDGIYQKTRSGKTELFYNGSDSYTIQTGDYTFLIVYSDQGSKYYILFYSDDGTHTKMEFYRGIADIDTGTSIATFDDRYEDLVNKVTALTAASTNTEYPSAKCVYDELQAKQAEIDALYDQIPTNEVSGTIINVQDSSNLPIKDFAMLGNATQADTPTPDSPQDIHVVTGDNTVKKLGKNWFNGANVTTTTSANWGISFENDVLTIEHKRSYTTGTPIIDFGKLPAGTYVVSGTFGGNLALYKDNTWSATLTSGTNFEATGTENIDIRFGNNNVSTLTYKNVMLEKNSTPTSYEPYTEQTQLLSLPFELAKIGDYTDRIYKQDGKWWLEKNIKKVVFNENTSFQLYDATKMNFRAYATGVKTNGIAISNYFAQGGYQGSSTNYPSVGVSDGNYIYIRYNSVEIATQYGISDTTSLKNWLSTHNTTVYFILNNSSITTTEITDQTLIGQLENCLKLHTYKTTTNFWLEPSGTNALGSLDIVYRQDLQTLTDKISNLEARVSLLE